MNTRHVLVILGFALLQTDVQALTPPGDSDGPIRLLNCIVSPNGLLVAEVDNQSDDAMACHLRCNYDIGGKMLYRWLDVTIPAHFNGRVGRFDTLGGKAGNYSGEVGTCQKTSARGDVVTP